MTDENIMMDVFRRRWIHENNVLEVLRTRWIHGNIVLEVLRTRWIDKNSVLELLRRRWIDENSILEHGPQGRGQQPLSQTRPRPHFLMILNIFSEQKDEDLSTLSTEG